MKKKLPSESLPNPSFVVKAVSIHTIITIVIVSQILVFFISSKVELFPDMEILQSIITTFSEIIAGLYGIILASYTFFLSRMDGLTASDMTLDFIVSSIKNRFKYLMWYITGCVLMTLVTCIGLMYSPAPTQEWSQFIYRLVYNEYLFFLGFAMILILYYSVQVIDPNCLAKEAEKLKKRICPGFHKPGSVVEFIGLYDRIEACCNAMIPDNVLSQIHENKGKHFEYTIEFLKELRPDLMPVLLGVYQVHRYYECMVNCKNMSVAQDMCVLARKVLKELEKK